MKRLLLFFLLFIGLTQITLGQEEFKHHKVMIVLGHAMTPEGVDVDGKKTMLFLPSWGLDYDYRVDEKWSLGLHSDFIIENFAFEDPDKFIQERSTPLAVVVSAGYKLGHHFTLLAGGGAEFAKEENLSLLRFGVDYGWELGDWEIAANYMFDFKIDAYNTGVFGVGLARSF